MTCHTLFGQTVSDTWATGTKTEGHCLSRSEAFSGEIDSASFELKEYVCFFFYCESFLGSLAGFPWQP